METLHHNRFMALFRDHPGEPVPGENYSGLYTHLVRPS